MLKRFFAWLKGSHQKRSDDILRQFTSANVQLQELNNEIIAERAANDRAILDLQEKNALLFKTYGKNASVASNIAKLLGEE